MRVQVLVAAAVLSLALEPGVRAHHSFAAEYDGEAQITVSGTVVKIDWSNPHIFFSMAVQGDDGKTTQWRFEGYPPNMLVRNGWKRDETLKIGDRVTVFGWGARGLPNAGAARWVTFADGHRMAAGPPAGTGGR